MSTVGILFTALTGVPCVIGVTGFCFWLWNSMRHWRKFITYLRSLLILNHIAIFFFALTSIFPFVECLRTLNSSRSFFNEFEQADLQWTLQMTSGPYLIAKFVTYFIFYLRLFYTLRGSAYCYSNTTYRTIKYLIILEIIIALATSTFFVLADSGFLYTLGLILMVPFFLLDLTIPVTLQVLLIKKTHQIGRSYYRAVSQTRNSSGTGTSKSKSKSPANSSKPETTATSALTVTTAANTRVSHSEGSKNDSKTSNHSADNNSRPQIRMTRAQVLNMNTNSEMSVEVSNISAAGGPRASTASVASEINNNANSNNNVIKPNMRALRVSSMDSNGSNQMESPQMDSVNQNGLGLEPVQRPSQVHTNTNAQKPLQVPALEIANYSMDSADENAGPIANHLNQISIGSRSSITAGTGPNSSGADTGDESGNDPVEQTPPQPSGARGAGPTETSTAAAVAAASGAHGPEGGPEEEAKNTAETQKLDKEQMESLTELYEGITKIAILCVIVAVSSLSFFVLFTWASVSDDLGETPIGWMSIQIDACMNIVCLVLIFDFSQKWYLVFCSCLRKCAMHIVEKRSQRSDP